MGLKEVCGEQTVRFALSGGWIVSKWLVSVQDELRGCGVDFGAVVKVDRGARAKALLQNVPDENQ